MKKNWLLFLSILISSFSFGQDKLIGFQLSPGITVAHIRDDRPEASGGKSNGFLNNPSDGLTTNEGNQTAFGATFIYQLKMNDKFYFSTGLGVVGKSILLRNRDGGYTGTSKYNISYLQLPFLAKVYFSEPAKNTKLYFNLGLTMDLKVHEDIDKKYNNAYDGAHYWNFAKNYSFNDPDRGTNADHKSKALFAPLNLGVLGGVGIEYDLYDFILFGGLSYNVGLLNTLNPGLKFNDINQTKVTDGLSIRTDFFAVDLGVVLPLK